MGADPSPERQSTAYFFNRVEGGSVRFVAYQRAADSEMPILMDAELEDAIDCLWPNS